MRGVVAGFALLALLGALALAAGGAAQPRVDGPGDPRIDGLEGERFELRFAVTADETANYTLRLAPREGFSITPGELTKQVSADETRVFLFDGEVTRDLDNGNYLLTWKASKENVLFREEQLFVKVLGPTVNLSAVPDIAGTANETFKLRLTLGSSRDDDYTLRLLPHPLFDFAPAEWTQRLGPGEAVTFASEVTVLRDLPDGEQVITWVVYRNGSRLGSGAIVITMGTPAPVEEDSPAPSVALAAVALAGLAAARRRRGGGSAEQGA